MRGHESMLIQFCGFWKGLCPRLDQWQQCFSCCTVCGGEVEAHLCYHQKNMVSCNLYKWWKLGSYTGLLSLLSMIGWEAQISRRRLRPLTRMPLGWLLQELNQTSLTGWSPWGWPRTCWREPQEELELVIEMSGMTFSACCQHLFLNVKQI